MTDLFEQWHEFLRFTRDILSRKDVTVDAELTDLDIAVQYVTGVLYDLKYTTVTNEMIYHMIMALTDVMNETK